MPIDEVPYSGGGPEPHAVSTERLDDDTASGLRERLAQSEAELARVRRALAVAEARVAELASSTTFAVGKAITAGARHPARAIVTVPRDLARIWRRHRSRTTAPAPAADRVVPIALPASTSGPRSGPRSGSRPGRAGAEGLLVLTAPERYLLPRYLAQHGLVGYEADAFACFLATLDVAGPGAVYDVGANVGIYAALASAVTDRDVRAFEPTPDLADLARRFATDNALGYRTESLALGAEDGRATLYLSDRSDASNSLAANFRQSSQQLEVPVETIDSYVARTGAVPAVLKVDTESTEPEVLAGATKTIETHRPWILCEVLAGRVERRLNEVLQPFGYRWFHVTDGVPYHETESIVGDTTYRHLMWLFAPERPDEAFWTAVREHAAALAECTPARGTELLRSGHRTG